MRSISATFIVLAGALCVVRAPEIHRGYTDMVMFFGMLLTMVGLVFWWQEFKRSSEP